jgi:hypothetical protein
VELWKRVLVNTPPLFASSQTDCKTECTSPLSSFCWQATPPKADVLFRDDHQGHGTFSNQTRRTSKRRSHKTRFLELASEWAASFYDDDSLEVEDVEIRIDPLRFWLITFNKAETDEEFYAVVLPDGKIVEPEEEERV